MFHDIHISSLSVFFAGLAYFLLGTLWYSTLLFGNLWKRGNGHYLADLGQLIIDLVMAFFLALVLRVAHVQTMPECLLVAAMIWVGFVATAQLSAVIWTRKTFTNFIIHGSYVLLGLLLMSVIICLFNK